MVNQSQEMSEQSTSNPSRRDSGIRLLYMILFALIYSAAEFVLLVVIIVQLGFVLISGERHTRLLALGASLSKFVYQILQFVTFNSEIKPFPFADWPIE